jgi:hypothetical protein
MTQDVSTMTVEQLKAALDAARKAQKDAEKAKTALPRFAFLMVTTQSTLTYWQGQAVDYDTARQAALDSEPDLFYGPDGAAAICDRPLPNPKGRKPGTKLTKAESAPEQTQAAVVPDSDATK